MYESLYRLNIKNGDYIIDVALDDYMDFFHEWDSASFKTRDVHPELAEYLDLCSEDIQIKKRIELNFNVQNSTQDETKEGMILASFRNYYTFLHRVEKRDIRDGLLRALLLAGTATAFIFAYFLLEPRITGTRIWIKVLVEGLLIGGWVFMWEAVHIATFQISQNVTRKREIQRFLKAPISFSYNILKSL